MGLSIRALYISPARMVPFSPSQIAFINSQVHMLRYTPHIVNAASINHPLYVLLMHFIIRFSLNLFHWLQSRRWSHCWILSICHWWSWCMLCNWGWWHHDALPSMVMPKLSSFSSLHSELLFVWLSSESYYS